MMLLSVPSPTLKGYHFPRSVIGYAVWASHRCALSLRDVKDLLSERGITVSHETIRDWVAKFGTQLQPRSGVIVPSPPQNGTWTKL